MAPALIKSPFPVPPTLPPVNVHNFLFGRDIPDHVCQVDGITGEKRTKNEFVERVLDGATGLSHLLGDGDEVIAVLSDNCMDYITLVHSALVLTTPITFFSTFSTPSELAFLLRTSKATRFFVGASYFASARKAAKLVGLADDRIYILHGRASWGRISFQGVVDAARKGKWERVKPKPVDEETLAYLVFSSGTSGLPKAVKITHYNIISAVFQFMSVMTASAAKFGPPPALPGNQLPTGLAYLPLYHSYGLFAFAFRAFLVPSTTVFMPKWDLDTFLKLIPQYKVNSLSMIPSLIHQLVHAPHKLAKADFSSISMYTCGAAALPKELGEDFQKLLPPTARQIEGYGLSEATIAVASPPPPGLFDNIPPKPGSLGVLYPGLEARILLDDGTWGSYGQIGELCVKGPTITQGYWQNDKANKDSFIVDNSGRWLRTGDRFRADEDSTLWFEDRAKDTLKISGMQVSPQEIELCLLSHPKKFVIDVTVAGVPGSRTSDEKVPRAWVVLSDDGRRLLDAKNKGEAQVKQELDKWVAENLSKYKWLRGGMEFVDQIPKSPTGKVLRRQLVDAHVKKQGSATAAAKL